MCFCPMFVSLSAAYSAYQLIHLPYVFGAPLLLYVKLPLVVAMMNNFRKKNFIDCLCCHLPLV